VASGANGKGDHVELFNVDHNGNSNLIVAAEVAGVKHFVLVARIGTDDILNPLNLFWGVSEGCGGQVLAVMWWVVERSLVGGGV
jgi:hypothetical protein